VVFLDVAIGLVFLFCMMSLAASAVREVIEGVFKSRAIMLEYGIRELVGDATAATAVAASMTKALFDHPQINGLFSGEYPETLTSFWRFWRRAPRVGFFSRLPSYIPARNFAVALLDTVARGPVVQTGEGLATVSLAAVSLAPLDLAAVRRGIPGLPNARLQRALLNVLDEAGGDVEAARQGIARWYDAAMGRVSGWYRRETQAVLFGIGLAMACALNIDAVAVGQRLLVDPQWRSALVASAGALNCQGDSGQTGCQGQGAQESGVPTVADVGSLEEVLGKNGFMLNAPLRRDWAVRYWFAGMCGGCVSTTLGGFLEGVPGYLIVAFATSLGAAFWFDVLSKLMMVRSTFKPAGKSGAEGGTMDGVAKVPAPVAGSAPPGAPPGAPAAAPEGAPEGADDVLLLDPTERPREEYAVVGAP
jgi:hypothetical protein